MYQYRPQWLYTGQQTALSGEDKALLTYGLHAVCVNVFDDGTNTRLHTCTRIHHIHLRSRFLFYHYCQLFIRPMRPYPLRADLFAELFQIGTTSV